MFSTLLSLNYWVQQQQYNSGDDVVGNPILQETQFNQESYSIVVSKNERFLAKMDSIYIFIDFSEL